jgi:uncharacterized protein (DUF924 family)
MPPLQTFSLDKRIFNSTLYSSLLRLWFDGLPVVASAPTEQLGKRWFGIGADESEKTSFDLECRSAFHEALSSISPARFPLPTFSDVETDRSHYPDIAAPFLEQLHHDGSGDPDAALGLTLLLDQIPRNIFRKDQALIYGHYDRIARAVFYALHKHNLDQHERYFWSPPYRHWFYMPLMHSESLADHRLLSQTLGDFKSKLEAKGDGAGVQAVGQGLSFDQKHSDILQKFGRYPYRNHWLGRETTDQERIWLEEGGERFGS